jgi:hypothetical protein
MFSMKETKKIGYWLIPPGIKRFFFNIRIPHIFKDTNSIKRNIEFKNIHRNERCFILATGPSIKNQNLKLLKDETCIATSNFYLHPDYSIIKPKYYCIAPYHQPITEEAWQNWMCELDKVTENSKIFFGVTDKERNQKNNLFVNREVYFLNFNGSFEQISHKGINLTRMIPSPQSVPVMALEIAIYMGFSEIYLLGCDHDWILHLYESRHFYDEKQSVLHNNQYNEWENSNFESQLISNLNLWNQYKKIKTIADYQNIKIWNATQGGLLDVFPRKQYETLFDL